MRWLVYLAGAMSGAAVMLLASAAFDLFIDDPAVRREARAQMVAVAELERAQARERANALLLDLERGKRREIEEARIADALALAAFRRAEADARAEMENLQDEIDELLASRAAETAGADRPCGVPSVRELVGERLRQR